MNISLFIPAPVNIYICTNTFVKFIDGHGEVIVGQVVDIHQGMSTVTMRRFLTPAQLISMHAEVQIANVAFWPTQLANQPPYLCATDIGITIKVDSIVGLAFVFYHDDPTTQQIQGLANCYIVSSVFSSSTGRVLHIRTFLSFPSLYAGSMLLSCFPSMIFQQLMTCKQKVQMLLNTRSKVKKCSGSCIIPNIDPLTWEYMRSLLPSAHYSYRNVVIKKSYLHNDEFMMEKYRAVQISTYLCLPEHLPMVQKLFGTAVGLGCRKIIRCSLKRRGLNAREVTRHQIVYSDTLNVIPFEEEVHQTEELVRRGLELKFIAQESELTVKVHYRKLSGKFNIEPQLQIRNMAVNHDDIAMIDDNYPLFADTTIFGATVKEIDLGNEIVTLSNNNEYTIREIMIELDRLI